MKVIALPCSFDNYAYLIICEETSTAAVVDPAEYYPVYCALEEHGVRLVKVLCTHHHADHIGGLEDLATEINGLEIYGHYKDRKRITRLTTAANDGDRVVFGNLSGEMLHTPGHTSGSSCYLFGDQLFTGDTLFGAGCGRLFEGSPAQMFASLNRLRDLPPETTVWFGHEYTAHNLKFAQFVDPGNEAVVKRMSAVSTRRDHGAPTTPSTLRLECATNPFLRCEKEGIRNSVAAKFFGEPLDPLSVFTALRKLKDSY